LQNISTAYTQLALPVTCGMFNSHLLQINWWICQWKCRWKSVTIGWSYDTNWLLTFWTTLVL